jgi:nucleoside-diphosphate-sugar epimerase
MKRVLVTGATGFVGRHALGPLAGRGYEVHAVRLHGGPGASAPATWHQADLMDPADRERLLDEVRPSHLLHFAWYAVHGKFWTSPENMRWVEASLALLRGFADREGRRAVLAGTCAEYDWRHGFCSEGTTPLTPSTLYGVAKGALCALVTAYARQVGLGLAWGRIFFIYGPDEQPGRLVPSVLRDLLANEPVRCSHGRQVRDFLHVEDLADAFVALLESDVVGAVNVASGRPTPIRDVVITLADAVSRQTGRAALPIEFGAVPSPPDDPPLLVADVRRLRDEIGWAPRLDLGEGLAAVVEASSVGPPG